MSLPPRTIAAMLALAVLGGVAPSAMAATKPLRDRGAVAERVVVDGSAAVWQRPDGVVVAREDVRGTERTFGASGCVPLSLRDTLVLLRCGDAQPPTLLSIADGQRRVVPGWQLGELYSVIGRVWLLGQDCSGGRGSCASVYLDWRSGRRVVAPGGRDLDSAELGPSRPLGPPYVRTTRRSGAPIERAAISLITRRTRVPLSRCPRGCTSITAHDGLVSWLEGRSVRAYDISRRRFLRFAAPGFAPTAVEHTARRVYAQSGDIAAGRAGSIRVASWR